MTPQAATGLAVVVAVLAVSTALGLLWRRRRGRLVAAQVTPTEVAASYTAAGADVTLLQFSAAYCAPCNRVRVNCAELAVDGVRHVELDVQSHPTAVRDLGVWQVPTLFVVDAVGRPVWRAVGMPDRAELLKAIQGVRSARGRAA